MDFQRQNYKVASQDFDLGHGTKKLHLSATFTVRKFSYKLSEVAGRWLAGMAIYVKDIYKNTYSIYSIYILYTIQYTDGQENVSHTFSPLNSVV